MNQTLQAEPRLLIVGDVDRLGPIVKQWFAPNPIFGIRSYLAGVAEIRRAPTRAVLVGHDPSCRRPEAAVRAMKDVAGDVPVVFCCEPAYEDVGRRLVAHGADDYVIFPPDAEELERAFATPSEGTRKRWIETPVVAPVPTPEELARLADLLPRLVAGDAGAPNAMAALVCSAVHAAGATVVLEGTVGQAGEGSAARDRAVLIEPISRGEQRVGQIRLGESRRGGYTHEDTAKLRHYGVLFGRMIEGAERAEELRRLAFTDELTGLANRRQLMAFLDEKLPLASQAGSTVTLLYFDIDDFKLYNDTYGHEAGDEILRDIGRLFLECTRDTDMVARFGGDEFVVVFWDAEAPRTVGSHHPQGVADVVARFRERLRKHTFARLGLEASGNLTISGGMAHYPWDARDAHDLIETADRGLYRAKDAGKNRFWIIGDGDASG
jgi:diguanylate cyclase (GGDEF)-like protein